LHSPRPLWAGRHAHGIQDSVTPCLRVGGAGQAARACFFLPRTTPPGHSCSSSRKVSGLTPTAVFALATPCAPCSQTPCTHSHAGHCTARRSGWGAATAGPGTNPNPNHGTAPHADPAGGLRQPAQELTLTLTTALHRTQIRLGGCDSRPSHARLLMPPPPQLVHRNRSDLM
jgi:hypothetical protein